MIIIANLLLLLLLFLNFRVGRSMLYPPAVFAGVWTLNLLGLLVSGDSLYPISSKTYLVYVLGAIAFSFGGLIVLRYLPEPRKILSTPKKMGSQSTTASILRFIDVAMIVMVIVFPFYWKQMTHGLDLSQGAGIFQQIRIKMVESSNEMHSFSIVRNFDIISQFVALVAVYEFDGSSRARVRTLFSILIAIVYGSASGTKGNVITLFIQLFFIISLKKQKIHWRSMLLAVGLGICFFSIALLWINYAYMNFYSISSVGSLLAETIQNYWLGGLVTFDRIVHNPGVIPSTEPIYRFFLETARSLGIGVLVPPLHAEYTSISPNGMDSNTYTIYFSYFKEFGWIGMLLIMLTLGAGLALLYHHVKANNAISLLFYSQMCVAIVFSFSSEHFFVALNSHIKLLIFLFMLYRVLPWWERRRRRVVLIA